MTPQQQAHAAVADPICTLSDAVNQAIDIAMGEDPEVFALGEDIEDPSVAS
jgi:pyruvate/2-oxoglutarate/acetoin dehydrogenase E1 component